jgi:phospholipid/cholesterol/gamma-HCH transport system permease protein
MSLEAATPPCKQPPLLFPLTRAGVGWLWQQLKQALVWIGRTQLLVGQSAVFLLKGQASWRHVLQQTAFVMVDSLPLALTLVGLTAVIIALQVSAVMAKQGAGGFIGALVSMVLIRELAPIMVGFSMVAMVGSAFAAQLASMRNEQQIEALRMLHISPVRYLVLPRLLALMATGPIQVLITGWLGLIAAQNVAYFTAELPASLFWMSVWQQTEAYDLGVAILKAAVFGASTALIACTVGFNAQRSAEAVGQATTTAVVVGFVVMALWDLLLTAVFY